MVYNHICNKNTVDLVAIVKEYKNFEGKLRAEDIKFHYNYIQRKYGEAGLDKLKNAVAEAGYDLPDVEKMSSLDWLPIGISTILMCAYTQVFDWTEKEIFQMGYDSILFKKVPHFLFRYFLSPEKTFSIAATSFSKYCSLGVLKFLYYDKEKQEGKIRLYDYKIHPTSCLFLAGFFLRIEELALGKKNSTVIESKCMHKGDPYHEFISKFNYHE